MQVELKVLDHAKEFYSVDKLLKRHLPAYMIPTYATPGSAGIDLMCIENVTVYPGETVGIRTGVAIWIGSSGRAHSYDTYGDTERCGTHELGICCHCKVYPQYKHTRIDVMGLLFPRSGLGTKGLVLANTIGVIDEDYQGELIIKALNRNDKYSDNLGDIYETGGIELKAGDRVAQLLFVPVVKAQFQVVDEFSSHTERGVGGFGSTGS